MDIPELRNIEQILRSHRIYRHSTLNLIASENVMSPAVERLMSIDLSHRYGDYTGIHPRIRKYTGNRFLTEIDLGANEAGCSLFGCHHADIRPLSGHVAGVAVLMALCSPGDTVLELDAPGGGHRLAQKLSVASLCPLRVLPLPVDEVRYTVDADATVDLIEREKPRVVVLGSSLFLFPHPVRPISEAAHRVGAILQFDASHVLGLIAGGAYPNPLDEGADVLTSSTHKTFAGPQGGLLLTNQGDLYERIAPAIYPALVTNHHLYRLPAFWAACEEWKAFGRDHAAAVVANAKGLGAALDERGIDVVGKGRGYTETHTVLIADPDSKAKAYRLEESGILVTPVGLPTHMGGGCLRLGVQEVTRRGMTIADVEELADIIVDGLHGNQSTADLSQRVEALARRWQTCRFTWGA